MLVTFMFNCLTCRVSLSQHGSGNVVIESITLARAQLNKFYKNLNIMLHFKDPELIVISRQTLGAAKPSVKRNPSSHVA